MKSKTKLAIYALALLIMIYALLWAVSHPALLGLSFEASFRLSPGSRLPRWFAVPPGYDRKSVTVQLSYYAPIPPFTYDVTAELLGPPPEYRVLDRATGMHRLHRDSERRGYQIYPIYFVASVKGIDEVIEHSAMEPVFSISDEPRLVNE